MAGPNREAALRRLERLAELLDHRFAIPGVGWRFGLDGMLGLIPGIGDAAGGLISLYLVNEARRHGAPWPLLARMLGNVGLDLVLGAIPLIGDLFDFAFKANHRNVKLLRRHLQRRER